jgi:hypothetical protein
MASGTPLERLRALDIRLVAAAAATLMLVVGVMWVIPTTPNSNSFTFDTSRRSTSGARPIKFAETVSGAIVDGSDTDFYEVGAAPSALHLDVRMTASDKLIPGLRIFDATNRLVQDKSMEYVRQPGANIETSFLAKSNMTYYVQVFSQRNTTGPYTLSLIPRQ